MGGIGECKVALPDKWFASPARANVTVSINYDNIDAAVAVAATADATAATADAATAVALASAALALSSASIAAAATAHRLP